jgi:hypothetical protein
MAEELRVFLRTGLYIGLAALVYWIITAEWAGSLLMAFMFLGAIFFVAAIAHLLDQTHGEVRPPEGYSGGRRFKTLEVADRILGFEEHPGRTHGDPLALQENPMPESSVWPILGALATVFFILGVLWGPWLWAPALVLGLWIMRGWLNQLSR